MALAGGPVVSGNGHKLPDAEQEMPVVEPAEKCPSEKVAAQTG